MQRKSASRHNRAMTTNRLLLFAALLLPLTAIASPIAGGPCGTTGTAAEFIALGDTGCNLVRDGARIYDIRFVTIGIVPGTFPEWPTLIDVVPPLTEFTLVDSVERTEI